MKPTHILLVEDNPTDARLITALLEARGHVVAVKWIAAGRSAPASVPRTGQVGAQ